MTDDIIRSMKRQMNPSDDTVADLLAKISALEASPETANTPDSFERYIYAKESAKSSAKPKTQAKKFTTKSIWFYGTAAVASVIVLVSSFSMLGGTDPQDIQNSFEDIVDNPSVVLRNGEPDENITSDGLDVAADEGKQADENSSANQGKDKQGIGGLISGIFDNGKNGDKDKDKHTDNTAAQNVNDKEDNNSVEKNNDDVSDKVDGNNFQKNETDSNTQLPPPPSNSSDRIDSSKVTPGAPGSSDISWSREILSDTSVSNISISGSNYVIETVASSAVASSEVKTISLEIPATETTNHTMVKARVKCVKNVSKDLMVAVDANGFKGTLLYTNKDYSPASLGQFVDDAGLNSGTSFARAVYCKGDNIGYSSYQRFNVDGVAALVEKFIFSCKNASLADYSSYQNGNVHVLFKSGSNPTCSVIDFGVSDNGYLYIKMASGNSYTFHIDASNAQSFISSITGM